MNRFKNFLAHYPMRPMNRAIVFSLLLILLSASAGCNGGLEGPEGLVAEGEWLPGYYVKAGGDDSLDGLTLDTAWATIAKVEATVTSGDTVYFRSQDTWSGIPPVLTATAGVTYDGSTYGSGTRATFQATGDGTGLGMVHIWVSTVTFEGFKVNGNGYAVGGIYVGYNGADANISDIAIDNCEVLNGRTVDDGSQFYYGIIVGHRQAKTTSNVTITDSEIHHTGHEGITVYPSWAIPGNKVDTALIRNCIIHDTGLVGSRGNAIDVCNDADNITVEYNTIYNSGSNGLAIVVYNYENLGSPDDVIFRYNLLYDNAAGISIISGDGTGDGLGSGYIYSNILINNGIGLSSGNYESSTIKIYNNTVYRIDDTFYALYTNGITGTPTIEIKNNIFYTDDYACVKDNEGSSFDSITHTNNLYYRASNAAHIHINISGVADYNRAEVTDWEATAQNTDPNFTGGTLPTGFTGTYGSDIVPNTNYFAITSGPALDNGATLGSPYDGCINWAGLATPLTRPQELGYEIGAYEYKQIGF